MTDDPGGLGWQTPWPQTNMCDRSGFYIHGDNAAQNNTASHGCIIMPLAARDTIDAHGGGALHVVPLVMFSRITLTIAVCAAAAFSCAIGAGSGGSFETHHRRDLTIAGLRMGEASFAQATAKFGQVTARETGDAGRYRKLICFRRGSKPETTLALASGPLGGGKVIDSFQLARLPTTGVNCDSGLEPAWSRPWHGNADECRLVQGEVNWSTPTGLSLGMPARDAERILGSPSKRAVNRLSYSFESNNAGLSVLASLEICTDGIVVTEIRGSYLASY